MPLIFLAMIRAAWQIAESLRQRSGGPRAAVGQRARKIPLTGPGRRDGRRTVASTTRPQSQGGLGGRPRGRRDDLKSRACPKTYIDPRKYLQITEGAAVMPWSYQIFRFKSWTFVENGAIVRKKEADMARNFLPHSSKPEPNGWFVAAEFEPLLNSEQAAELLQVHHKTLQKLARRGEIHGTHVGKLWRFRASDLNDWLQKRAS